MFKSVGLTWIYFSNACYMSPHTIPIYFITHTTSCEQYVQIIELIGAQFSLLRQNVFLRKMRFSKRRCYDSSLLLCFAVPAGSYQRFQVVYRLHLQSQAIVLDRLIMNWLILKMRAPWSFETSVFIGRHGVTSQTTGKFTFFSTFFSAFVSLLYFPQSSSLRNKG